MEATQAPARPQHWMVTLPQLTRWTLRQALEDAILTAQACGDEPRERRYLQLLDRLETV